MAVHQTRLLCGITGQVSQNPQFYNTIDVCDLPHILFLGENMFDFIWNAPFFILQLLFVILFWCSLFIGGYYLAKDFLDKRVEEKMRKRREHRSKYGDDDDDDYDDYIGV